MSNLVKRVKSARELHDQKVRAYWALFLMQNANPHPDLDGSFYLGEITDPKIVEQRVLRDTPYSTARGLR